MYQSIEEILAALRIQRDLVKLAQEKLVDRSEDLAIVSDALDDVMAFLLERKAIRSYPRTSPSDE